MVVTVLILGLRHSPSFSQPPGPNPQSEAPQDPLFLPSRANQIKLQLARAPSWKGWVLGEACEEQVDPGDPRMFVRTEGPPCLLGLRRETLSLSAPLLSQLCRHFLTCCPGAEIGARLACLPGSGGEEIRAGPLCGELGSQIAGSGPEHRRIALTGSGEVVADPI